MGFFLFVFCPSFEYEKVKATLIPEGSVGSFDFTYEEKSGSLAVIRTHHSRPPAVTMFISPHTLPYFTLF